MKKCLIAVAALVVALTWSCSSKEQEVKAENDYKAKIENCTNPDSLKLYVQQASDYALKLAKEGKTEEAQAFVDSLAPVVQEKAGNTWTEIIETVKVYGENTVDSAKEAVSDAAEATAEKVSEVKDSVASKAANAVEKTKEGVSNVAEKTAEKVEDTAKKGIDAVKKAGSDVASKASDEASKLGNKLKK